MATLHPGDLLDGRYRIATSIAQGGMSTVYAAVDTRLDREVAVKVMDSALAHDATFRTRFEREARAVAKLSHPTLVNVFDQGEDNAHEDCVFLVMELVQGGSLRELLRERGPMPPHAVVAVMEPVLTALSVAHSRGMIHRDIKPDNVLIGEDHQVKLADFGLVRAIGTSSDTSHGQVIGTAAYLSPEQVRGSSLTHASDVYSAGILMFELITGSTPFRADSPVATAAARLTNEVPLPSSIVGGVPQEFDDVVATACHSDPEQRYVDGQEFLDDLRLIASQLSIPPFNVPIPQESKVRSALHGADFGERKAWDDESMATRVVPIPQEEDPFTRYETRPWDDASAQGAAAGAAAMPQQPQQPMQPAPPVQQPAPVQPPAPPKPLSNRSATRTILSIIIVIALVASVTVGAWWLTSGRYGEIPSVLGMNQTAATQTVDDSGFSSQVTKQYSDDVAQGGVIGTDPPFGERALRGSHVVVLVSNGKPIIPEPSSSQSPAHYRQQLSERTLHSAIGDDVFSEDVPAGEIARVEPSPGTSVKTQSEVTIYLSKGPEPLPVPDVVGDSESAAKRQIEKLGLKVTDVVEEELPAENSDVKAGRVIRTDPPVGTELTKGDEVTVYVAGSQRVPLVFGRTGSEARELLENQGFRVKIEGDESGRVYTQTPGPTAKAAKGSTVTIRTI